MSTSKFFKDYGLVQFGVFEKFTSTYLFQIAPEKSCDYLLITYMKKCEMVKKKKCTHIMNQGKIGASRVRLILKANYCSLSKARIL